MSDKNDGGPAFPRPFSTNRDVFENDECAGAFEQDGMSLRDWFAGKALGALIQKLGEAGDAAGLAAALAEDAYKLADAMLAARAKAVTP